MEEARARQGQSRECVSILLVDDDRDTREIYRAALERAGFRVETAVSGRQAERLLGAQRFGLVITDLYMPDGGGRQLLESTRPASPELPFLVITNYADRNILSGIQDARLRAVLEKPIAFSNLITRVREILGDAPRAPDRDRPCGADPSRLPGSEKGSEPA